FRAFLESDAIRKSEAALDRVRAPVLLVWGADDAIVPADVLVETERRLSVTARPTVLVVPDAGHLVPMSKPVTVAQSIDAFVAALPAATSTAAAAPSPVAPQRSEIVAGRAPGSRIWGLKHELHPVVGIAAL